MNIDWDDSIGELKSSFDKIVLSLQNVENVILNRCYFINEINDPVNTVLLHGFSDVSELAYGACIYIKSIQHSGNITVNLVILKSRIIPMKKSILLHVLSYWVHLISKLMVTVLTSLKHYG